MPSRSLIQLILLNFIIYINFLLPGCSYSRDYHNKNQDGPPKQYYNINHTKKIIPKFEPKSKYGNPGSYTVFGKTYKVLPSNNRYQEIGLASWYGSKFHGKKTSSGEIYNMFEFTAAHKSLPLPTYAKITNLENNKSLIVKINDRGPFVNNRIIDLSYAAALKLGFSDKGTANVKLAAINFDNKKYHKKTYIQLEAFKNYYNARKYINKFNIPNLSKKINIINENSLFKIHLGPYFNNQQVATALKLLNNYYINKTLIIKY